MNQVNTAVLLYYMGYLCVGINSSVMNFFIIGFLSQWWLRRYYPNIFVRYNYLVSAALDGGTSIIVFIMSFALFGAAGNEVNFPQYWGNNVNGNFDLCLYTD
jgi:OPT oligopeptide transporter protein